jgi:uncharacterized membrane protein YeiH
VDLDPLEVVRIADRVGIVAMTFTGVEVGMRRRMDVYGLLVLGVVTATGGGLLRDVMLGRTPFVLDHADYLLLAVGGCLLSLLLIRWLTDRRLQAAIAIAQAIGLGAFAASGGLLAIEAGMPMPTVVVLGIVTATGGGVVRDVLADRIPTVLRTEANATVAGIGAALTWAVEPYDAGLAALVGAFAAAFLRLVSLAFHVHLPRPRHPRHRA